MPADRWSFVLLLVLATLAFSMLSARPVQASGTVADAPGLITDLGSRAIAILDETAPGSPTRHGRLHTLIEEKFDVPLLAQYVTGRYWDSASVQERTRFIEAFGNHVTDLVSTRFARYTRQTFAVVGQSAQSDGTALVWTEVAEPNAMGGERVDWRVENTAAGMKIIDVSISGMSIARAKREEFGSILERDSGGLPGLSAALESRSASRMPASIRGN